MVWYDSYIQYVQQCTHVTSSIVRTPNVYCICTNKFATFNVTSSIVRTPNVYCICTNKFATFNVIIDGYTNAEMVDKKYHMDIILRY